MTLKQFFTGRAIVISVLLVIGLGFLAYDTLFKANTSTDTQVVEPQTTTETPKPLSTEAPIFEWKFEKAETLNPDGLPAVEVYLQAAYGGDAIAKLISTEPGGCNVVKDDTKEKDIAADSSVALCYAAGAGARFKVVKGESSYKVMKQEFEEGSPEYNPPIQSYKTIAEFPFAI